MSPNPKQAALSRPSHVQRRHVLRIVEPLSLPEGWDIDDRVPRSRSECVAGPRPCPHVLCRHHLWAQLEQDQAGDWRRGRQGFASVVPSTMETCALDIAAEGASCEEIGAMLGIDDTRVRQLIDKAIEKVKKTNPELAEYLAERNR